MDQAKQRGGCVCLLGASVAFADTLTQVTSSSAQGANDSLSWSQRGADGTVQAVSFTATTAMANSITVGLGAANSVISVVCTATPCSWTGTGFTAGHALLWTSDAGNGGSGPVTLIFSKSVSGAGALVQADLPGPFTGEIQLYNGSTLLGTYAVASDAAGDPVYLGALDQSGPNINKVVFSLTTCASLCTDFGLDTVNVNAVTAAPAVTLTPTSLTFASTPVGSTTAAQLVTVKNSGTATLNVTSETITGINPSSFLKFATTCGATLAVGATCTVSVEFKPAATGTLTASLAIADNASGSPQVVTLTGTATAPAVTLTPTSLTFASTAVGSTTAAQLVTIKNSGTATLNITSETIAGIDPSSFLKSATTCGATLAVGSTCTVSVEFKPATTGTLTASLAIADNASGSPQVVTLTGTGTAPAVTLSPTSLTFASTTVGSTTAAQLVTVKNSGTATLNLTSETITGIDPSSFLKSATTCGATLAVGATCTVSVEFKPAAAGTLSALLSFADNASGSPQSAALTGTGVAVSAPVVSLTPASIAFPATTVGLTTAAQLVTLKNTGTATLTMSSIALGGTNPTSFVEIGTCGTSLAAGASCSLYVGFRPAAAVALSATLSVTDNAAGSPHRVTLTGTGTVAPTLKLSATTLTFPTTLHGTTSAAQTITLTNSGTSTMTLNSITLTGANPADFVELNTCGSTLAPAATCSVYVAFKPAAAGAYKAALSIADNGAASPQSVALAGAGN